MSSFGTSLKEKALAFFLKMRVIEWKWSEKEKKLVVGWRFKW